MRIPTEFSRSKFLIWEKVTPPSPISGHLYLREKCLNSLNFNIERLSRVKLSLCNWAITHFWKHKFLVRARWRALENVIFLIFPRNGGEMPVAYIHRNSWWVFFSRSPLQKIDILHEGILTK